MTGDTLEKSEGERGIGCDHGTREWRNRGARLRTLLATLVQEIGEREQAGSLPEAGFGEPS
jgi:hypothetical protein